MNSHGFFDETSDKWIRFFRGLTILTFFLFVIAGILGAIGDASQLFLDFDLGGGEGPADFLVWIVCGVGGGIFELVVNMLFIQLLNNVQAIRKRMESLPAELAKTIKQTSNSAAPGSETKRGIAEEVPELPEL